MFGDIQAFEQQGNRSHTFALQTTHQRAGQPACFEPREFLALTCANDDQALGTRALRPLQDRELIELAGKFTTGAQFGHPPGLGCNLRIGVQL